MSDLSTTSCCKDNKCDNGISPLFLILILSLCGGDNDMLGGCFGNKTGGCNSGLDSMLPILLLLFLGGGSLF